MTVVFFVTLILISVLRSVSSDDILVVFAHPGKSHVDVFLPITKALAEKGHKVTVLGYYPLPIHVPNYKDINLKGNAPLFVEAIGMDMVDATSKLSMYTSVKFLSYLASTYCEVGMRSDEFTQFMKKLGHFDIMIMEMFNTDCFIGLAELFDVPVIGLSSCTLMPWNSDRFANIIHPAYIPNNLLSLSDRMTFLERVENTVLLTAHRLYYKYVMNENDKRIAKKYLDGKATDIDSAIKRSSLLLVNTHFSLNLPRPYVPNVIEIGGVHIGKTKPLPEHIEKWINESSHGVIYLSLGSLLKGHTLPKEKREVFQKVFSRLPQRVIWKWENDTMEGKPDNVMTLKWVPQLDVLNHPNVKAFISHGGLLGTIEAVHCGKPIVVMPQFGDQHTNARAVEASGGGVILNYGELSEQTVYEALTTVLDDSFQQQAKELSARYRDRPLPPLETAIYWIEYVIRHKGAPHMRTAAVDMPWYQYYLIDVIVFLAAVISLPFVILLWTIKMLLRQCIRREKLKTQ